MKDQNLIASGAMPNAAATVNTAVLALPQRGVRPFTSQFRARLANSQGTGANTKNITYTLYGSNESNGANAAALRAFTVAGNGTAHPASEREVYLDPESDKRFLFASATGEEHGGNAANGTFSIEIIA